MTFTAATRYSVARWSGSDAIRSSFRERTVRVQVTGEEQIHRAPGQPHQQVDASPLGGAVGDQLVGEGQPRHWMLGSEHAVMQEVEALAQEHRVGGAPCHRQRSLGTHHRAVVVVSLGRDPDRQPLCRLRRREAAAAVLARARSAPAGHRRRRGSRGPTARSSRGPRAPSARRPAPRPPHVQPARSARGPGRDVRAPRGRCSRGRGDPWLGGWVRRGRPCSGWVGASWAGQGLRPWPPVSSLPVLGHCLAVAVRGPSTGHRHIARHIPSRTWHSPTCARRHSRGTPVSRL